MEPSLVYSVLVGVFLGIGLSVGLNIYSKTNANSYVYSIFGMNVIDLLTYTILFALSLSIVVLSGYSVLIRDLQFPITSPINFTLETLTMAIVPSLVIFVMTVLRGHEINSYTWLEFGGLFLKFGLLHILLQFSGFYSSFIPFVKTK